MRYACAAENERNKLSGIDELRRTVALLNNCGEDFNQRFTTQELLKLGDMYRRCDWDIPPDKWASRQLWEALLGVVPMFDADERPVYREADAASTARGAR